MTPRFSTTLLRTQADQRLVELVQAGHEAAFTAIVERYRPQLHRYARRMLPESRVEDAVQQALMQAWRALQDGKDVRQLRPWLYTIVHNASVNQLRQGVFDYRELLDTVQGDDDPSEDVERLAVIRQTLAAVAALPERQRDALLAVVVAGRPQAQVAVEMGLTENGLRQLLFRARTTLRNAATAITPLPLLAWAARAPQSGGGLGGRIGEAAAGAGAVAGGAHVLQTGTALIVAGTLAVGGATALRTPHPATASRTSTLAAVKADPAAAPVGLRARHTHAASRPASHPAATKRHASAAPTRVLLAGGHGFRVAPLPTVSVAAPPEIVTPAPEPQPVAEPTPAPATTAPALAALPATPTAGPTPTSSGHDNGGGADHGSGTTNSSSGSSGDHHDGGGGGGNDGGGSGSSDGGSGSTQSAPASGGDSHSGPGSSGSGSSGSSGSSSSTTSSSDSHSGSSGG
jgi:RNA polymerase sigma factor (sigma-70 family)